MIRNQAGQSVGAQMINSADGSAYAGVVTVYITIDAGVQAIGSVGAGLCTLEGNGFYSYRPSQGETNGALIAFTFVGSSAIPQTVQYATITEEERSALQTATGVLAITGRDLVTDALREIGVLNPNDAASGELADFGMRKMNRLFDNWNAEKRAIYADTITAFTLTPSLQPHTLGPSGATWTVTQRPLTIDAMRVEISSGNFLPIEVHRDSQWWMDVAVPDLTAPYPTDVYLDLAWPNANLLFWPVPTTALSVEILTRAIFGSMVLNDTFSLPPGYQDAITLTLAESLIVPLKVKDVPPLLFGQARDARVRVFGNNYLIPNAVTRDAGMPGGSGSGYDFRTGLTR